MKAFAIYFLMLGLTTPVFAQQNTVAKNFTLRGKIYGKDSGTIILSFGMGSNYKSDTVNINNGEFIFRGSLFEPTVAVFKIENEYSGNIYLESAEMRVEIIRFTHPTSCPILYAMVCRKNILAAIAGMPLRNTMLIRI